MSKASLGIFFLCLTLPSETERGDRAPLLPRGKITQRNRPCEYTKNRPFCVKIKMVKKKNYGENDDFERRVSDDEPPVS